MIRICPERDAQCPNGMGCAEPCAGSSPNPLTPREKVLLAICENKGRTSGDLADAILTALASGSGDQAELARLAEAAKQYSYKGWSYKPPTDPLASGCIMGSEHGPVLATVQWPVPTMDYALSEIDPSRVVGEFIAAADPAAVLALIAEIAALRAAKWEVKHVDTMNDMVLTGMARDDAEARATEAERKLAEAVGLLKQALIDMDRRVITAETANRIDYFLSKEAERG